MEGLAVHGNRLFLGLRGPVLRGWAVIVELLVDDATPKQLRLLPIAGDRPYRKHFLDLRGLGVRDLCFHGADLLVLAGPTMELDGPAAVYRWRNVLRLDEETMVERDELREVAAIPYGTGEHNAEDHPEGLTLLTEEDNGREELLVVYDSPDALRLREGGVRADVFSLEQHD